MKAEAPLTIATPEVYSLRPKEIVAIQFIPSVEGVHAVLDWLDSLKRPYTHWTRTTDVLRRDRTTLERDMLTIHLKSELNDECMLRMAGGDYVYFTEDGALRTMGPTELAVDYEKVEITNG